MAEPSCSRRPTECMAWSRRLPGVWLIAGRPRRSATRSRIWSPAGLRHRLRAPRWQRCGPAGRRPDPQAAAGARPSGRRALGVAADGLALREQRGARRALSAGARVGGVGHRAASPPARGSAGATHHNGSGPDPDPGGGVRPPRIEPRSELGSCGRRRCCCAAAGSTSANRVALSRPHRSARW